MAASELALQGLAFVLTYAIHSTLLLGLACLLAPRIARSLALKERLYKTAMFGAILTALVQVGASMETPLFHWTLQPAERANAPLAARAEPEPAPTPASSETLFAASAPAPRAQPGPRTLPGPLTAPGPAALPGPQPSSAPASAGPTDWVARAPATSSEPEPEVPLEIASTLPSDAEQRSLSAQLGSLAGRWREWTAQGLTLWAVFAALVLGLFAHMCMRLARRMRGRQELASGALRDVLDSLLPSAFPRGQRVRLYVAPDVRAPVSFGFLRPSICVPPRALTELSADEQETMLAHELAHLMRRDPLWLSIAWLVERVFFFQPLNRVARAELHDLAELLCDDWAARRTGNRLALASCLARIAGWLVGGSRALPATSMAEHHGRCRLTQRIERLLDDDEPRARDDAARRWLVPAASATLSALVLIVPGVSAQSGSRISAVERPPSAAGARDEAGLLTAAVPAGRAARIPLAASVPLQLYLRGAFGPAAPPDEAEPRALELELDELGQSLALLRDELRVLRDEAGALSSSARLTRALEELEVRVERLDGRRAQLNQLIQVLETLESMPAHPSSTPFATQGS